MAFPSIPAVADGRILFTLNTTGGATKTFPDLSSLTKNAGDLLIAICVEYDGNSTNAEFSSWGGGFTEIRDAAGTATMAIGVAYKFSTGSETGTFTVTTADTSTNDSVMILLSIEGAHASQAPETSAMTTATNAIPPAVGSLLSPSWGAEDTLWIAVGASGETSTTGSFTAIGLSPTNYPGQADSGITADVVGGLEASVAFRQLNTASEGPNGWGSSDTSNVRSASMVIAVRPAASTSLTPASLTRTRAQGTILVNPTLKPSGLTRTRAQGSPVVSPQVLPGSLTRTRALGDPAVSVGSSLSPAALTRTRVFGTLQVNASLVPTGLVRTRAIGTPVVNIQFTPASLVRTRALGSISVGSFTFLSPASLVRTRTLGTASVLPFALPGSIVRARAIGTPTANTTLVISSLVRSRVLSVPSVDDGLPDGGSTFRDEEKHHHHRS